MGSAKKNKLCKEGALQKWRLHPGRLTWNIIIGVWNIMFLSKWVICRFHVNLPGCKHQVPFRGKNTSTMIFPGCDASSFTSNSSGPILVVDQAIPTPGFRRGWGPWVFAPEDQDVKLRFKKKTYHSIQGSIFRDDLLVSGRVNKNIISKTNAPCMAYFQAKCRWIFHPLVHGWYRISLKSLLVAFHWRTLIILK